MITEEHLITIYNNKFQDDVLINKILSLGEKILDIFLENTMNMLNKNIFISDKDFIGEIANAYYINDEYVRYLIYKKLFPKYTFLKFTETKMPENGYIVKFTDESKLAKFTT